MNIDRCLMHGFLALLMKTEYFQLRLTYRHGRRRRVKKCRKHHNFPFFQHTECVRGDSYNLDECTELCVLGLNASQHNFYSIPSALLEEGEWQDVGKNDLLCRWNMNIFRKMFKTNEICVYLWALSSGRRKANNFSRFFLFVIIIEMIPPFHQALSTSPHPTPLAAATTSKWARVGKKY